MQEGNKNVKLEFETLLRGGTIPVLVDEQIVFSQLLAKKDALWNFLLATGYLKVAEPLPACAGELGSANHV